MDTLYTYYKSMRQFLKLCTKNKNCLINMNAIKSTDTDKDVFYQTFYEIKIDDDWINMIESKLDFIAKCIKEERQFILRNGEVIPIEKVKSVSRESVSHLARHSNLIKRAPEDEDNIIPDELYTVEKLTDYSVYENRFLYFLLCYLRDFIDLRYNAIIKYSNMYKSNFAMDKDITISNRKIKYNVNIEEVIENDKYKKDLHLNEDKIERIESIYRGVLSYLHTPLMIDVSKSPMIKQPIVITNVLKMNQNFKAALELYNFIVAYDKKGYEIIEHKKINTPLYDAASSHYALMIDYHTAMDYIYNNDLVKKYKEQYEDELEKEKQELINKNKRDIRLLLKRLEAKEITIEEYVLEVEKVNHDLVEDIEQLNKRLLEIDVLKSEIETLNEDIILANNKLVEKDSEIETITKNNEEAIENLTKANEEQIETLTKANEEQIENLTKANEEQIENLTKANEEQIESITKANEEQIEIINKNNQERIENIESENAENVNKLNDNIQGLNDNIQGLNDDIKTLNDQIKELKNSNNVFEEKNRILQAQLTSYRYDCGDINYNEDFISKENFEKLEQQAKLLKSLIKKQWKITKKEIVREAKEEYSFKKVKEEEKELKQKQKAEKEEKKELKRQQKNEKEKSKEIEKVKESLEVEAPKAVEEVKETVITDDTQKVTNEETEATKIVETVEDIKETVTTSETTEADKSKTEKKKAKKGN